MQTNPELKYLTAADTHRLRLKILKDEGEEYAYDYEGDNLSTTFHLGLMKGNDLICIASFFDNVCVQAPNVKAVQLRGMATDNDFSGFGFGKLLMKFATEESQERGYDLIWCNARVHAIPFYEKLGFECVSAPFMVPRVGMHRVMKRQL